MANDQSANEYDSLNYLIGGIAGGKSTALMQLEMQRQNYLQLQNITTSDNLNIYYPNKSNILGYDLGKEITTSLKTKPEKFDEFKWLRNRVKETCWKAA